MTFRTAPDAFAEAARTTTELIGQTISKKGVCAIVVSGGSAVRKTIAHLVTAEVQWSSVRLYMADERCIPREDTTRNDVMIHEVLVQPTQIKPEHFNQIPAELGPIQGAKTYSQTISAISYFDIALLGVGTDGHIASLFPNHPSIDNCERVIAVENSPKFPPNRVSVGLSMLRGSTHRIVVVAGTEKSDLIAQVQRGQRPPVVLLEPTRWFLDSQVAGFMFDEPTTIRLGQTL